MLVEQIDKRPLEEKPNSLIDTLLSSLDGMEKNPTQEEWIKWIKDIQNMELYREIKSCIDPNLLQIHRSIVSISFLTDQSPCTNTNGLSLDSQLAELFILVGEELSSGQAEGAKREKQAESLTENLISKLEEKGLFALLSSSNQEVKQITKSIKALILKTYK